MHYQKRTILFYLNNNHKTCHHPTVLKKINCHVCLDPMIHVIRSDLYVKVMLIAAALLSSERMCFDPAALRLAFDHACHPIRKMRRDVCRRDVRPVPPFTGGGVAAMCPSPLLPIPALGLPVSAVLSLPVQDFDPTEAG